MLELLYRASLGEEFLAKIEVEVNGALVTTARRFEQLALTRRDWLSLAAMSLPATNVRASTRHVNTVTGPVEAGKLGRTLMHEHIIIDFVGAAA